MISSRIPQYVPQFDEIIGENDDDFFESGLKGISVVRVGRLATVEDKILFGAIGQISPERLYRIGHRLSERDAIIAASALVHEMTGQ
uniref:Uncharacterized protein n=1 Tax=Candidatus Kentrum sp. DK TaxID=2126562 RepID=A0A450TES8_9GAMM|nr:MAG: hypothetical protein BECKDK2373C_GA0170839_11336 [Candidatus Kentron sp. DK]